MGKKKRMVLLVLGIIILGIAIYQYPLQKAFAQKAFKAYIDEQGIDPDNIAIKKLVKDWKQGGYLIVATFNVIVHRFCCLHPHPPQGRGSVRGEPLTGSPTRVQSPARRRPILRSKIAAPKKYDHPKGGRIFLERATRLELATSTLARSRSTR